jgi:uncharacterized DUF497 family protein
MTTIDRAVDLMKTVQGVVLTMRSALVADSMMTDRVVAIAALTTARVAVLRMKKSRAVAVRVMSVRKTRCTIVRKPLARSA